MTDHDALIAAAEAVLLELDIIRKHREDTGASSLLIVHPMTHADLRAALDAARRDPEPVASADAAWEALGVAIDEALAYDTPDDADDADALLSVHRPAIEAAIRGTEARASLDVERLARALRTGLYLTDNDDPNPDEAAAAIARAYAAEEPKP